MLVPVQAGTTKGYHMLSRLFFLGLLLSPSFLFGTTPFSLEGISKLDVVVENNSKLIQDKTVKRLEKMMHKSLNDLNIKTKEFSPAVLILLISTPKYDPVQLVKAQLMVAEQVRRRGSEEESFGFTYRMEDLFEPESLHEDMIESLEFLLGEFSDQYKEDNGGDE